MDAKVRLTGLNELHAALEKLPLRMQDNVYNGAIATAARRFRTAVKAATPLSPELNHPKYGHARDLVRVSRDRTTPGIIRYVAHTGRAFWMLFYEFGTRHQPARPVWRPTFDAEGETILKGIADGLKNGLVREAKRLAGEYAAVRKSLISR